MFPVNMRVSLFGVPWDFSWTGQYWSWDRELGTGQARFMLFFFASYFPLGQTHNDKHERILICMHTHNFSKVYFFVGIGVSSFIRCFSLECLSFFPLRLRRFFSG
jgi:ABC-type transport system involved in cytochrome c biogenesis permease subunit